MPNDMGGFNQPKESMNLQDKLPIPFNKLLVERKKGMRVRKGEDPLHETFERETCEINAT